MQGVCTARQRRDRALVWRVRDSPLSAPPRRYAQPRIPIAQSSSRVCVTWRGKVPRIVLVTGTKRGGMPLFSNNGPSILQIQAAACCPLTPHVSSIVAVARPPVRDVVVVLVERRWVERHRARAH